MTPPIASPASRSTALVLSGGGARGAYEAGVVSQLYAQGEKFDIICGTSIGAFNGAFIAQYPAAADSTLRGVWSCIQDVGVIKEIPLAQAVHKLLTDLHAARNDGGLKRVGDLLHALGNAPGLFPISQFLTIQGLIDPMPVMNFLAADLEFSSLQLPFIFVATDLTHGASQVFYTFPDSAASLKKAFLHEEPHAVALNAENYAEAVRASGAIPIAFSPVAIPGLSGKFVDGGVANNTPIGQAIDVGATHITVIFMDPETDPADSYPSGNLLEISAACYAVMAQTVLQADFNLALRTNKSTGALPKKRIIHLREFRPQAALPLSILDFDKQNSINHAFSLGVADARRGAPYRT